MKVIVAGSRGITSSQLVQSAIEQSGFPVTLLLSGGARGVDRLGEQWAEANGIPVQQFTPDWDGWGKPAGHVRNRQMAEEADALVAIWDGVSPGTRGMIQEATKRGKKVHVLRTGKLYTAYCDGASRKDKRGGWGAHITSVGEPSIDLCGGDTDTTNNRMELLAPIEVMWYLPERSCITFVCDSQYVVYGASEYIHTWVQSGWIGSTGKAVANRDLWEELISATARHETVTWQWVKGHAGNPGNERADALATLGVPDAPVTEDTQVGQGQAGGVRAVLRRPRGPKPSKAAGSS